MVVYLNCTVGVQNPGNNGNVPRRQSNQPRRRSRYNPDGPGGSDDMNKNINSPSKFQQQQQMNNRDQYIHNQSPPSDSQQDQPTSPSKSALYATHTNG